MFDLDVKSISAIQLGKLLGCRIEKQTPSHVILRDYFPRLSDFNEMVGAIPEQFDWADECGWYMPIEMQKTIRRLMSGANIELPRFHCGEQEGKERAKELSRHRFNPTGEFIGYAAIFLDSVPSNIVLFGTPEKFLSVLQFSGKEIS